MTILTMFLPLLTPTLLSLSSCARAFMWNEGLAIAQRDTPNGNHESKTCWLTPLGYGKDDTDNVLAAISHCGVGGTTIFSPGNFNITRKMMWNLTSATVELHGYLNFVPDIQYWLNTSSTYRVIFIEDQPSWFVVSGQDFVIDAFNTGGIQGNGQPWWQYFKQHHRYNGDGRPISFTLYETANVLIRNFRIESPPYWSNAVANSVNVTYDGMLINATNTNATLFGQDLTPNTDGIDTYRADNIKMLNWNVISGDDCLALKGNSTNIEARNITCHGGNGIALGSLGQYSQLYEIVANVTMTDLKVLRTSARVQPEMIYGVYIKSWDGSIHGTPPVNGGGGNGTLKNITLSSVVVDQVNYPVYITQNYSGQSGDTPSYFQFSDITYKNWTGTANSNTIVDLECSSNAPCPNITFIDFNVSPPSGEEGKYICQNMVNEDDIGLNVPCNNTGEA